MRKRPQQERSRQMVAALIEATGRSIAERGLDGTTTPHIAELAGVSVGSLYQYFDDKDALIEALLEKMAADVALAVKHLPLDANASLRAMVEATIRFGYSILNSGDGLYLELMRNWHRLPTQKVADVLQQQFMELSRMYFLKHYHDQPIRDLQVRVFIIANGTIFTMVRSMNQGSALLRQEDLVQGLTEMIVGYLEAGARVGE